MFRGARYPATLSKRNKEGRPLGARFEADLSAHPLQELTHEGKPDPCAAGGEVEIEDMGRHIARDAASIVLDIKAVIGSAADLYALRSAMTAGILDEIDNDVPKEDRM